jgi:hypothetical protein
MLNPSVWVRAGVGALTPNQPALLDKYPTFTLTILAYKNLSVNTKVPILHRAAFAPRRLSCDSFAAAM